MRVLKTRNLVAAVRDMRSLRGVLCGQRASRRGRRMQRRWHHQATKASASSSATGITTIREWRDRRSGEQDHGGSARPVKFASYRRTPPHVDLKGKT